MQPQRSRATWSALATATLLALVTCGDDEMAIEDSASGPSIEGSYRLLSRDLPDGTTLEPPEIFGLMTFTDGLRHFHIHAPVLEGDGVETYSHVAEYDLTETRYSETPLYEVINNEAAGGLTYAFSSDPRNSPVTPDSETVTFGEVGGGPDLVFTTAGLTATQEGQFVDHWERIE
jgi:hypothetical protein